MNDTSGLVSELLDKLADFDLKVHHYRQDLAGQFRHHSLQLLRHQPRHVSDEVYQAVARSLHSYPALGFILGADGRLDAPSASDSRAGAQVAAPAAANAANDDDDEVAARRARSNMNSPPPVLPHTSGTPPPQASGLISPDEREHDFHEPSPPTPDASRGAPTRPDPIRRLTADTISSTASDDGSHPRRSALRRSSSSSIKGHSPRRVRFDVEGEEVSTTTSPMLSPRLADMAGPTPLSNSSGLLTDTLEPMDGEELRLLSDDEDDSLGLLGSSPPAPKKISSTDRLKAMARSSTENTSDWMVMGNAQGSDDEDEDEGFTMGMNGKRRSAASQATAASQTATNGRGVHTAAPNASDSRTSAQVRAPETIPEHSDEDESDEDILEMPALSSFKNRKRFSPTEAQPQSQDTMERPNGQSSSGATGLSNLSPPQRPSSGAASEQRQGKADHDEEDMFDFDDDEDTNIKENKVKPTAKYLEEEEPEEIESAQEKEKPLATSKPPVYSASPGVPIVRRPTEAPVSPQPRMQVGSVGSYRGRSLVMGSVVNDKIHEKAAQMGDFSSFIGSVDGRTGPDESSSYRPPVSSLKGTPKSLSERLLKEEMAEVEAGPGEGI